MPHRGVNTGKSRLSPILSERARGELNCWLLARTLRIACEWLGDAQRCVVVSPCVHTLALAQEAGAITLLERAPAQGLNAALAQGAAHAEALGAQHLLILPCDLPRLDVAALQSMAALSNSAADDVIAPDRHGAGTNALLVDASVREFAFGANSFAQHVALSESRGARALTCVNPALAFDLDTADDFSKWQRSGDLLPPFLITHPSPA
ncbi:MAG: 2-phospho-L-lactate guanylyltransferase [Burkholderiales bacterium]